MLSKTFFSLSFYLLIAAIDDERDLEQDDKLGQNHRLEAPDFPPNSCLEGREGQTLEDMTRNKNDKGLDSLKTYFKLPLVWIKLEMTGLNVEVDRILEIACVITDGKLRKLVEGPDLVIHQTKEFLDKIGERGQDHHAACGLSEKVTQSRTSEKEAEELVIDFVKGHVCAYTPSLAGNSVYVDFMFLKMIKRLLKRRSSMEANWMRSNKA
ncbi:hypothetical protein L1987_22116 [Smallanthus sonchifolius]|uniref:Uncharacterized protein n=1 Tax=Smallanthus sonchifolius TaxID=185202 RepID=A0ACB9IEX2_9ASTR|nr:hypothetical protein L1987_22116 [Smallanthus sonchifolius]